MDYIINLPSDKIPLSSDEKDVFDWLYPVETIEETVENPAPEKEVVVQTKFSVFPILVMITLIFLFTFRPIDQFFQRKIPLLFQNSLINSLVKTVLFIAILFLIQYVLFMITKKKKANPEK
jgi:uncharacterized protein YqhQ